jgi:hypothetical protein
MRERLESFDVSRLTLLSPRRLSDETTVEVDGGWNDGEHLQCDVFGVLSLRNEKTSTVILNSLSDEDFLFSWYRDVFVQDHVALALRQSALVGFELLPTLVRSPNAKNAPKLWEMRVTGFAGFASSKVKVEKSQFCADHRVATYRTDGHFFEMIDPLKWDGSDLFTIWPFPLSYVASERFERFCKKRQFSGIVFESLFDRSLSGQASPGLPAKWLSAQNVERLNRDVDYVECIDKA